MHAIYMNHIGTEVPHPNMLIFIDTAAKDKWTSTLQRGWLTRGVHCCVQRYFVHGTSFSIIPAITLDGIVVCDIVEGPVYGQCFLKFLEEHVVCFYHFTCVILAFL